MDLKETDILGPDIGQHWYYRSKARAMLHMLKGTSANTLLDVGAGSGFFSHHLLTHTATAQAWCVDISYPADSDASTAGKPVRYRRAVDSLDADLVLLMDVLEHVDDDVGLLKSYVDKVPSGSRFLITVPAFQFLWSGHDDFLEHKRRYTLKQLETVVAQAGLQVQQGAYYFGLVFPIAAGMRLLQRRASKAPAKSQLSRHHPLVNGVLRSLCSLERPIMGANRIAGLTVFCLAQKP
ncbi:class I SAM-dependent methyltransferase [Pseudomonas bijieensis]|uniref:class I SAM-dependent methyltransferase n=1 Tax=Pseudomonas bijieensis TaxID=2681983 RepID=UPI00200E6EAB|nr:methyltransferase domain-containing protein [Pseudomonas bijieensis]UQI32551.1 class I SAM-dependent methyltransferase [Pseudomonas bijieensis]